MNTIEKDRARTRPVAGERQNYPLYGEGVWTSWKDATEAQRTLARHLDRPSSQLGALLLVAVSSGRVLRVLAPVAEQAAA